ncbi:spore germination protein [Aureibacillus halotolerans]|uniref:Stage V sporulation protein AF n=1 Tax=Aureibacillus halotolerans TaxID=1508390 RepID=A0A4R6UF16_9BACI|nr:spore germination protein [Aureibacillus halotolerans]TDQ41694.1 stage V sporulation protein AF [Aureibacillus halotolerans]
MHKPHKRVPLTENFTENIAYLHKRLGVDKSFDVIQVDLKYANRKMALFLIDGFVKDDIMLYIMRALSHLKESDLDDQPLDTLMKTHIPYIEIGTEDDLEIIIDQVLSGPVAMIVEGVSTAILIDARTYPVRGPEEPDVERVVRGARDGFVETIVFNTAMTRRRIRDRSLRMEYMQIGRRSKTDICISYLEDIADPSHVAEIKKALESIDTDGLPMAEKTIEEFIFKEFKNPYPLARYTERPDTAASHLFEGHVIIIVDGSPSVLITPTTFFHHLQHAEEYRQKPIIGTYLRGVRFLGVWLSLFMLPLWFLLAITPELLPDALAYIGVDDSGVVPLLFQFLIIEVGLDLLRMAAIHTPSSLATALGLVAAVLIGQVAVEVGLFSNEVILYLSIAAIGTFATPSYELSIANRLFRIFLLLTTGLFGVVGFVVGVTFWVLFLVRLKGFDVPYLWPLLPFNREALKDVLLRAPIPLKHHRPKILHPKDPDR